MILNSEQSGANENTLPVRGCVVIAEGVLLHITGSSDECCIRPVQPFIARDPRVAKVLRNINIRVGTREQLTVMIEGKPKKNEPRASVIDCQTGPRQPSIG